MKSVHDAIESFTRFSAREKTDFLTHYSHRLTILARDTYEAGGQGLTNPSRLRAINEIQHRLTSFLLAIARQDRNRFSDEILIKILLDHPDDPGLQRQLHDAFDRLTDEPIPAV